MQISSGSFPVITALLKRIGEASGLCGRKISLPTRGFMKGRPCRTHRCQGILDTKGRLRIWIEGACTRAGGSLLRAGGWVNSRSVEAACGQMFPGPSKMGALSL